MTPKPLKETLQIRNMSSKPENIRYYPGENGYMVRHELCDGYSWSQDIEFVSIFLPIGDVGSKGVAFKLTPTKVCLGLKGSSPIIDDELFNIVKPDDSLWEIEMIEEKRTAVAKLRKAKEGQWMFLFKKDAEREDTIRKERAAVHEAQHKANMEARERAEREVKQQAKSQGGGGWVAEAAGRLGARLVER